MSEQTREWETLLLQDYRLGYPEVPKSEAEQHVQEACAWLHHPDCPESHIASMIGLYQADRTTASREAEQTAKEAGLTTDQLLFISILASV